ncbi:hypothetical protein M3Y97_01119300 [Aphelenchoides bicaudatus]|nr:hypothetical protein M3Y97_01119300 [Aphelenchoides bicaudatus]
MKAVALLLLASASIAFAANCGAPPTTSVCDAGTLDCCDGNLQTTLNLDCSSKTVYQNPDCIEKSINTLYFDQNGGALTFCGAYNDYLSEHLCGAGLDTYLRTADADPDAFVGKIDDMRQCNFVFRQRLRKSPDCKYLDELVRCYQKAFLTVPELAWYMCELARAFGAPQVPHCDVSCSSNA